MEAIKVKLAVGYSLDLLFRYRKCRGGIRVRSFVGLLSLIIFGADVRPHTGVESTQSRSKNSLSGDNHFEFTN